MGFISFVGAGGSNTKAGGVVARGTEVTLGNLKARIPTSGNVSLQLATVSGTYSVYGCEIYALTIVQPERHIYQLSGAVSIGTSFAYIKSDDNFLASGEISIWTIHDTVAEKAWRITVIFGSDGVTLFAKNTICIEELA